MEHRRYVIIQLEEAKRFIQTNRVPYLRLALLLLDNASEIQMYRAVEHELDYNDLYKRMQDNILQILKDHPGSEHDLPETLRDILQMKLLNEKDKKKLDKYFDQKLQYLGHVLPHLNVSHEDENLPKTDKTPYLDESVADVLSHLHNYRNEAYHRAKVRPKTLLTAALILFEINCDFFLSLSKHYGLSYSSADDYSDLEQRYGISKPFRQEDHERIVSVLKANLPIDDQTIKTTLAEHLDSRLIDLDASLEFIRENLTSATAPDKQTALEYSQFYVISKAIKQSADVDEFKKFKAEYTYNDLEILRANIPMIHRAPTRIETFRFCNLGEETGENRTGRF